MILSGRKGDSWHSQPEQLCFLEYGLWNMQADTTRASLSACYNGAQFLLFFGKVTALLAWRSETINTTDGFNEPPQKNTPTLSLIPPVNSTVLNVSERENV